MGLMVINIITLLVGNSIVSKKKRRSMLLFGVIGVACCDLSIAVCYAMTWKYKNLLILGI